MKMKILPILIAASALLGSCSGVYKSSQTPDDVYYSPAKADAVKEDDGIGYYEEYTPSSDDNYLRMKVQDHYRWSNIDDYSYWNDSRYYYSDFNFYNNYYYQNNYLYYNPWMWNNSYYFNYLSMGLGWYGYYGNYCGSYYNPYATVIWYKNPGTYKTYSSNKNLAAFSNRSYNNNNYNNSNSSGGRGGRYSTANSSNSNNYNSSGRTTNSSSNSSYNNGYGTSSQSRTFSSGSAPSSSAGGRSGGYNSTGSGSAGGRAPRGH